MYVKFIHYKYYVFFLLHTHRLLGPDLSSLGLKAIGRSHTNTLGLMTSKVIGSTRGVNGSGLDPGPIKFF